jgi:hypothetical protein
VKSELFFPCIEFALSTPIEAKNQSTRISNAMGMTRESCLPDSQFASGQNCRLRKALKSDAACAKS